MAYAFGTGLLALVPAGSNPTPVQVGVLKDVSLDMSFTTKELRGSYQFALDIARAGAKISLKAKTATINGSLISQLMAGSTITTGSTIGVQGETGTVPATSTYTITVAGSATFATDFGVYDVTAGIWMARGATATGAGVYAESAGTYTFNSADASHSVKIYYSHTSASVGQTIAYTNQLMGSGATFQVHLFNSFRSNSQGVKLYAVTSTKVNLALKSEDYVESDMDFEAFADANGNVIDLYTV
jgi:hypothetical protein